MTSTTRKGPELKVAHVQSASCQAYSIRWLGVAHFEKRRYRYLPAVMAATALGGPEISQLCRAACVLR